MTAITERQQLRLHRRPGRRRAASTSSSRHEGMTLNIGPQHPATHGTLRIVARLDGEQVVACRAGHGLHAPRLREAHRGPHLPAGHHAGQPHRLARQLRQRGAVHPRRREAHGDRGAAPGPVDPHDPLRAVPHRQHHAVPRRHGPAARRHHRRPSTPSATASTCSTRSRRSPAGASTPTSTASAA